MFYVNPTGLFFNDLPAALASYWATKLQCQPSSGWDDVVVYGGWKDLPKVYHVCKKDADLPPKMKKQMADRAGSEIETCDAGHCCMIG